MRHPAVLAIGLACALAAGAPAFPARAQAAEPAAAAPAPKTAEDLAYFVGRWRVEARDPGGGAVETIGYRVEATPGGAWLAGTGASADGAFAARDMWGRDPLTGEVIRVIFDGSGTFATVRSPGWDGNRLVLEGEARSQGGVVRLRETITRVSPQRFEAVWEAFRDGEWAAYSVETVTREG